ncbi:MAG TPA: hypothetical protein VLW85_18495 [Myxococcales bacterium]|nr:hypothetical protein [Myxococcales bacterium]
MALILLVAAAFTAEPSRLVPGKDLGSALTLHASEKASVELSTTVGTITEPVRKDGAWTAFFTPPARHAPAVALILAQVDEGGDRDLYWLAIPLVGSDTMEIETRPGSQVEAIVAGNRIGPVTADRSGNAKLPMVVPPGVEKGTLRITDKLGNSKDQSIDLEPPPFTRLRMAARQDEAFADGSLELEIFAVTPDGTPDDAAKIEMASDAGELRVKSRIDSGVYLAVFEPAAGKSSAHLSARYEGQSASMDIPVKPAGPVKLWRSAMAPQRPWGFSAGPIGAVGATFDGGVSGGLLLEGALRIKDYPLEALIDLGGMWFPEVQQQTSQSGITYASAHTWLGQIGMRASRLLARGIDGHVSALLGVQDQLVHERSVTQPLGNDDSSLVLRAAFALGGSMRLGPGRLLAQVQVDFSPSGQAGRTNSPGGAQLQVGYLFPLR